jgi:hypothetical protein
MKTVMLNDEEVVISDKMNAVVAEAKLDDSGTVFFQRQLEAIEAQTYDVLYPDLEARECFPTFDFGGPGAQFLTFRSFDRAGSAQVINARAADLPKADISGKEYTIGVKSIGAAYGCDFDEIEAAKMTGMPLEARRAEAAKRGYEETINEIAWFGGEGLRGFFSTENGVSTAAPAKDLLPSGVNDATPVETAAMLHDFVNSMYAETKKIHKAEFLWMPVAFFHYISSTPVSETFPNETILSYFLRTNMYIRSESQIKALNMLADDEMAKSSVAAGSRKGGVIVAGQMNVAGKQCVRLREPLPLQFFPVQIHGLTYEIPARGRFAGVEVTYSGAFKCMGLQK